MMRILRYIPQWQTSRGNRSENGPGVTFWGHFRYRSEAGQSLPAALITLAVASLLLAPFLTFVSSRSLGTGAAQERFNDLYNADAGVEYGIWSLLYDPSVPSFRSQADLLAGTAQNLAFPGSLNGINPITISITALPIGQATPPVGVNLFTAANLIGGDVDGVAKQAIPFVLMDILILIILTMIPALCLYLPKLAGLY